jgi:chromate reductase, NAD(P)H dehydrogenase (quinone)
MILGDALPSCLLSMKYFLQSLFLICAFVGSILADTCSSKMPHIVAITGSLRAASTNTHLLHAIAKLLPTGTSIDIVVPHDLPLFNQDLESAELPATVTAFRQRLKLADGFIFAANEYNYSISGALKNAIDWGSRGPEGNLFNDKPAAVVSAGGGAGGLRAQNHLRDIAVFLNMHIMNKPSIQFKLFEAPFPFNLETGELTGENQLKQLEEFVPAVMHWINRHSTSPAATAESS